MVSVVIGHLLVLALIGGAILWVRENRAVERDAQAARAAIAGGRTTAAREPLQRWLEARPNSAEAHALRSELAPRGWRIRKGQARVQPGCARLSGIEARAAPRDLVAHRPVRRGRADPRPTLDRVGEDRARDRRGTGADLPQDVSARGAKAVIERWIEDAPTDGRPFLWLTEIDRRTEVDNPESWERHYREALRRDPELDPARQGLAESLRRVHRNEEATQEYEQYLSRHPDDPVALAGSGLNKLELGDLSGAASLLDRALALAPNDPSALKARAEVHLQRGELALAARQLDLAVKADPFNDEVLHVRARVRGMLGDAAGSRADREAFDRLRKDQEELLKLRGQLLDNPSDSDTRTKVAAWMLAHGREQAGVEWSMAILAGDPNHGPTCRLLADYYGKKPDGAGLANLYRMKASAQVSTP